MFNDSITSSLLHTVIHFLSCTPYKTQYHILYKMLDSRLSSEGVSGFAGHHPVLSGSGVCPGRGPDDLY